MLKVCINNVLEIFPVKKIIEFLGQKITDNFRSPEIIDLWDSENIRVF
jgi:hypothetical protein